MNDYKICPECSANTTAYHQSNGDGTTSTYRVCSKKCNGWKVLSETRNGFSNIDNRYYDNEVI